MAKKYHFTVTFYEHENGIWYADAGPIDQPGIWDLVHGEELEKAGETLGAGLAQILEDWVMNGHGTKHADLSPDAAFRAEYGDFKASKPPDSPR